MQRRRVLAGTAAAVAGLAGCLGSGGDAGGSGDGSDTGGDGSVTDDHTLDGQPYLGAPPAEASKLILGFEDPSCPNCARFHTQHLPDLESSLLSGDDPDAAFVWRPYRFTGYGWATPAIHAVLETTARDREAAWTLLDHYYEDGGGDAVLETTREVLASETGVDADAVVEAAESEAHADRLETVESEAEAANVTSTPTFLLFEDGASVTTISGPQDADQFTTAFEA